MNILYGVWSQISWINTSHDLYYKFSDINCDIMGQQNIDIDTIKLSDLSVYDLILNGRRLTYDPDTKSMDHLSFTWRCFDNILNDTCDEMLQRDKTANTWANFENITIDEASVSYSFEMEVTDITNPARDSCFDTVTFSANNVITDEGNSDIPDLLIISLITTRPRIKVDDRARIMAEITNMNKDDYKDLDVSFTWFEVNEYLTVEQIIEYQRRNPCTCPNNFNLILKPNVLTKGITYGFQLEIIIRDPDTGEILASGTSSIAEIYVTKPPTLMKNSLKLDPRCKNGEIVFDSMTEYLRNSNKFSLTVSADADEDNLPLMYRFGFKLDGGETWYNLHSNYLTESTIDNIVLPLGDVRIIARVFDATGDWVSDDIECKIWVNEAYITCPDLTTEFEGNIDSYLTIHEKYEYIFSESLVYLNFLYQYENQVSTDCVDEILWEILNILTIEIGGLCIDNRVFVIQLSQIMELWIDLAFKFGIDLSDNQDLKIVRDLIFKVLDPCDFIMWVIKCKVELLYLNTESIISNIPQIYYKRTEQDITSNLSLILTDTQYHDEMFSLIDQVTVLNDNLYHTGIYKLISSVLYIASLSSISTSVPGEETIIISDEFDIYSIRVSNQVINVTVQDKTVLIPDAVVTIDDGDDDGNDVFNSMDTIIVGTNSGSTSYNNSDGSTSTLSNSSLSVTISALSNNTNFTASNLAENVLLIFPCPDENEYCQDYICVWNNVDDDTWPDDGCNTTYNDIDNTIICSCSHLTTFAIIYTIHNGELVQQVTESSHFKYVNIIFAVLFSIITIYILIEIYPFFVDKNLNFKQTSIGVMTLLCIISSLSIIVCIEFNNMSSININGITCILLFIQLCYFFISTLIFYSWYILANSLNTTDQEQRFQLAKVRKYIFSLNISFTIFVLMTYIAIITSSQNTASIFIRFAESVWCIVLFIVCLIFILYGYCVGEVIILTAKVSNTDRFSFTSDETITKKLLFINGCITTYFLLQFGLTVYFNISSKEFNIDAHIINIALNLLFIILLCWMYKKPMRKLIKLEASSEYHKYHCCCSNMFVLGGNNHSNNINTMEREEKRNTNTQSEMEATTYIDAETEDMNSNGNNPRKDTLTITSMSVESVDVTNTNPHPHTNQGNIEMSNQAHDGPHNSTISSSFKE